MPTPDNQTATIDELMKQAGVKTTTVAPEPEKKEPVQGAVFMASDGRQMYKYQLDGETVVLPKPLEKMTEEDFYALPISLHDSMPGRIPQDLYVKFKDPQWAGYWFNKKAKDGVRVGTARSMGYVPAKIEDLALVAPHLNDQDGAVENGDLVLMKIHKAKLFLKYKEWIDKAKFLGGIHRYKSEAENFGGGDPSKVGYYHTPQALNEHQGIGPVTALPTTG